MGEQYIKIVGFGLIGEGKPKGAYRQVIFKDTNTNVETEFLLLRKERSSMWADVEKMEQGKNIPPYRGYITRYNDVDIVVFNGESIEDTFKRQNSKLSVESTMVYAEVEKMREETTGYLTNLTNKGAIEISWRSIDPTASLIKFRMYKNKGQFYWTKWHEIESSRN